MQIAFATKNRISDIIWSIKLIPDPVVYMEYKVKLSTTSIEKGEFPILP